MMIRMGVIRSFTLLCFFILIVALSICLELGMFVNYPPSSDGPDSYTSGLSASADVFHFSEYYEDGMVIQKTKPTIWGYSNQVNDVIYIKINNKEVGQSTVQPSLVDGHSGVWQVDFEAPTGGYGPYTITAQSSQGTLTLVDVWFGDVWLCSGQSNMEFEVHKLINASDEYADAASYQEIRLFRLSRKYSPVPLDDVSDIEIHWSTPNKSSLELFSALCWLYGKLLYQSLNYPIGLVDTTWGGTPIEKWSSPDALAKCPAIPGIDSIKPHELWNAMINPLIRNSIYGVIWYQGEQNSKRYAQYACQFPAMITDWREKFSIASNDATNAQFPFGFVQLSAWRYQQPYLGFPGIRWAQTANQGQVPNSLMPNTFMAVAMDLPDFDSPYGDIHPRDKHTIAERLVRSGFAVAYGFNTGNYYGPFPSAVQHITTTNQIQIEYDYGTYLIDVRTSNGFDVCCASPGHVCEDNDVGWKESQIISHDTTRVYIDASVCNHSGLSFVGGVRYAWRESPCPYKMCAIYGKENGLPAPPFKHSAPFNVFI